MIDENKDEEGIPKHIVHSFQIHQQHNDAEEDQHDTLGIDIEYYERNFPIGSLLSFTLQSSNSSTNKFTGSANDNSWETVINPCSFHIGEGSNLHLKSAVCNNAHSIEGRLSLYVSTNVNPDYVCICPNISASSPVHDLKMSVLGPAQIRFALVHYHDNVSGDGELVGNFESINLFGNVKLCSSDKQQLVSNAYQTFLRLESDADVNIFSDSVGTKGLSEFEMNTESTQQELGDEASIPSPPDADVDTKETGKKNKKRKISPVEINDTSMPIITSPEPKRLTKKERKKLAKQKERDLQQVIAKDNNHDTNDPGNMKKEESEQKRTRSITKPRTIQGGIRIQDIVHGSGSAVRNGRRVSINYVGTFPNDGNKIFDKNQSKGKPLTFRLGTGEVIKGLDRGMIGMKVGGEREITIPPKLGYGEKGTSGIPGNSTLCFTVQLKSMGGK
jgi:FKBP-type peptidyl-prolyl cis-trans isomerase